MTIADLWSLLVNTPITTLLAWWFVASAVVVVIYIAAGALKVLGYFLDEIERLVRKWTAQAFRAVTGKGGKHD